MFRQLHFSLMIAYTFNSLLVYWNTAVDKILAFQIGSLMHKMRFLFSILISCTILFFEESERFEGVQHRSESLRLRNRQPLII